MSRDKKMQKPPQSVRNLHHAGFTIIELMIAIALGLLILSALVVVFANTSAARNEIDRLNRQIENGRYATELLRDDLQLAGFFGEVNMAAVALLAPLPAALPDVCATTLIERTNGGTEIGMLGLHVQGINDFDSSLMTDLDSCPVIKALVKTGTDVLVVRRAKTCNAGTVGCDLLENNKPFLQVPLCNTPPTVSASTFTTHALGLGSETTEHVHKLKDCVTDAPKRPYVTYIYFVDNNNILNRAQLQDYTAGAWAVTDVTPLVDGIENMQLQYGVDTVNPIASPRDGNPDVYAAAPASVTEWSDVVSVQVNLLARNLDPSPNYTDTKTYPAVGVAAAFNDGFRRRVYSTLVRIQNVSAKREIP
jgi:type IV pilus assembly protein PilW